MTLGELLGKVTPKEGAMLEVEAQKRIRDEEEKRIIAESRAKYSSSIEKHYRKRDYNSK